MENCLICNGDKFGLLYANTLKKCHTCGFISANMKISEDILKATYTINYFKGEEYLNYLNDRRIIQLNFKKRIALIKRITRNSIPVVNSFEIGCAYGFFGEILLRHFQTEYTGIDVVDEVITYGKNTLNLSLIAGDYLKKARASKPYSDVFMWDVIEHLPNPGEFLKKAHAELEKGGRIHITTGDISTWMPRLQGKNWRMIHPPSHIYYFSNYHLRLLLEKYGFKVIHLSYPAVYRSVRQIFYSLFLLNKRGEITTKMFQLIPPDWYVPVNTFDIMLVIAEKI